MPQPGDHLGIYRLISRIGAGGMGEVWKGEDTSLGRTVAIKILPAEVANDPEAIARMKREARTAAQLYHPNIATIHAFDQDGDRVFIVMEYVEGVPLTDLIRRGPLAEDEVARIARSVAEALEAAHEKGIVHRDVKPDNIIVSGPRVKVLDFGIAKQIEQNTIRADDPTAYMTKQGYIVGTVYYMSPEQALGKPLDARTDLFSLGVVMYQAATGTLPFHGDTATETITQIVRDEPQPPRGVSPALTSTIRRCMEKDREARFASAADVARALDDRDAYAPTVLTGSKLVTVKEPAPMVATPRRWPWIAAMTVLVVLIGAAAMLASRSKESVTPPAPATVAPPPPSTTTVDVKPEPEPPVTTTTAAPLPAPAPPPQERTADDYYNQGVTYLVERRHMDARNAFLHALDVDPKHARAHFRLGEMALFMRRTVEAREHLNAALANGAALDDRERKLAGFGLMVLDRDRPRAIEQWRMIQALYPNDPDLQRFRELVEDERGDRPPPRFQGRRRPIRP